MSVKSMLSKLKELATEIVNLEVENVETTEETPSVELAQEKLENGTTLEADVFEAENEVFILSEDERVPLPVGEYELSDGRILTVQEEGMISSIGEAKLEEEKPEETTEMEAETPEEVEVEAPEYVTKGEFNEAMDALKSLFSSQVEKLEEEKTELQKQLDEKPDAEPIVHSPKVELKETPAKDKKGRIYQFLNSK
jgi:hypothetical protein